MLPPPTHANYERWRRYHDSSWWRGELVAELLAPLLPLGALVVDVGCGVGGTSAALAARGATVLALEADARRLQVTRQRAQTANLRVLAVRGDGQALPLKERAIDGLILQDMLEHVCAPARVVQESARVLKTGGVAFLSTPNRWSPWNSLADPHWGLPLIALLPRRAVTLLTRRRRGNGPVRTAEPALLSWRSLRTLMRQVGLEMTFVNRAAARFICKEPRAAFCARLDLRLASLARRAGMLGWLPKLVNDRQGLFNCWLNPTWYVLARKQ